MSEHLEHNNLIARWLEGDLNESERKILEDSEELNDLQEVLKDVSNWKLPSYNASSGYSDLKRQLSVEPSTPKKVVPLYSYLRYAAAAVLLLLTYFGAREFFSPADVTFALSAGETRQLELPDGSSVVLDASSTLSYNAKNWQQERNVHLEGQAFFQVAKGSVFTVETVKGSVAVLGTEFNVKSSPNGFTVVCYEGSVEVSANAESYVLNPGEGIRINASETTHFTTVEQTPSWADGDGSSARYEQVPLLEVVDDLIRLYDVTCQLPPQYHKLEFSGNVPRGNLEQSLKTIFVPMEISYSLDDDQVQFNP